MTLIRGVVRCFNSCYKLSDWVVIVYLLFSAFYFASVNSVTSPETKPLNFANNFQATQSSSSKLLGHRPLICLTAQAQRSISFQQSLPFTDWQRASVFSQWEKLPPRELVKSPAIKHRVEFLASISGPELSNHDCPFPVACCRDLLPDLGLVILIKTNPALPYRQR